MSFGFERLHITHVCPICRLMDQTCLSAKCGIGERFTTELTIEKPWLSKRNREIYNVFMAYSGDSIERKHFKIITISRMEEILHIFLLLKRTASDEYDFLSKYYSLLNDFYTDLLDELNMVAIPDSIQTTFNVSSILIPRQPTLFDPYIIPRKPTSWNINNVHKKLKLDQLEVDATVTATTTNTVVDVVDMLSFGQGIEDNSTTSAPPTNFETIRTTTHDDDYHYDTPSSEKKRKLSVSSVSSVSSSDDDLMDFLSQESESTTLNYKVVLDSPPSV